MNTPSKRSRVEDDDAHDDEHDHPRTLEKPISPPPVKRQRQTPEAKVIPSPWKLTWIRDLPDELNRDAITLKDILGDPLISECWEFNYLHDINFLMEAFDPDTRHMVQVHVVHGFWKREDANRLQLVEDAAGHTNVQLHAAYLPEMFGTHHTKMMVLFRHDDTAQVVIHTANMIAKDWTNMTNGVWQSPLLPMLPKAAVPSELDPSPADHAIGSGRKFKADLLSYLRIYDRQRPTCKALWERLRLHDFSAVRAAFIASTPGTHPVHDLSETAWGWAAMKRALKHIPLTKGKSEVVAQISSIATLGANDSWLQKTLFGALCPATGPGSRRVGVVFPTADEIRRSLDGYASGGSVHTKIQSAQQMKQLEYLRPLFRHWANDSENGRSLPEGKLHRNAGRNRAAPHIKTYIRYNESGDIDWALLTSANLSKQAWGDAERAGGEVRIASYEAGVLVWPQLFDTNARMVGTFQTDTPSPGDTSAAEKGDTGDKTTTVGVRIPYSVPLQAYGPGEKPWVATQSYTEPDCHGRIWNV